MHRDLAAAPAPARWRRRPRPGASTGSGQGTGPAAVPGDWLRLSRTARVLSWLTLAWMGVEGGVAVAAAVAAGSAALLGFGLGSGIEAMASVIVIWRLTGSRLASATSERRAQQLVAVSFFVLAPYITVEAVRALIAGDRAETSIIGLVLTAGTAVFEPALGWPSGGSVPGSVRRRPRGRGPRTCCAPTWPSQCSPGWPPTPCGVSGGWTAWSRSASLAGRSPKGGAPGPGGPAAAQARGRAARHSFVSLAGRPGNVAGRPGPADPAAGLVAAHRLCGVGHCRPDPLTCPAARTPGTVGTGQ